MDTTGEKTLDVRPISPKDKHPTIFETFDELEVGDHDPKPSPVFPQTLLVDL